MDQTPQIHIRMIFCFCFTFTKKTTNITSSHNFNGGHQFLAPGQLPATLVFEYPTVGELVDKGKVVSEG